MILTVVGARPNFVKMAPVVSEILGRGLPHLLVHTGQHYDEKMSAIFFDQLQMPRPDINLNIGSGSQADQTARIMMAFEPICTQYKPRLVMVGGDVNSTLACALTAAKLMIPVAHVESGLRSFDRVMPEEINRILTDHLSDLLFVTEASGLENLQREGITQEKVHFVGNTMIDSLFRFLEQALTLQPWQNYALEPGKYGLVTFHRPSNVDSEDQVRVLAAALDRVGERLPLLFPIHPRTLHQHGDLWKAVRNIKLVEPLGYLEFLGLMAKAAVVITDSGGIQEETTALGVRCVTVRHNTERPITVTQGTNRLVEANPVQIAEAVFSANERPFQRPALWDGHAAKRLIDVVEGWYRATEENI